MMKACPSIGATEYDSIEGNILKKSIAVHCSLLCRMLLLTCLDASLQLYEHSMESKDKEYVPVHTQSEAALWLHHLGAEHM